MITDYSHITKGRRDGEIAIIVHGTDKLGKKKQCRLLMVNHIFKRVSGPYLQRSIYDAAISDYRNKKFGRTSAEEKQMLVGNDPVILAGSKANNAFHARITD